MAREKLRMEYTRYKILVLVSSFLSFLAVASVAQAADYYVSTSGNDSNAGTQAAPWRRVSYAATKVAAGDTVYVRSGVYNQQVIIAASGTSSAPIKFLNYPGEYPILEGDQATHAGINLRRGVGWIVIEGFEIRKFNNGIVYNNVHDIVIRRNWIHDNTPAPNTPMTSSGSRHAQGIVGDAYRIIIDSNRINHNGNFHECSQNPPHCNQDHGMYIHGTSYLITNNVIHDNLAYGIQIAAHYVYDPSNDISPEYGGAQNWVIANNTIANEYNGAAIVVWGPVKNTRFENNIFYENGEIRANAYPQGIDFVFGAARPPSGLVINNNLVYATAPGGTRFLGGSGATEGVHYTQSGNIVNTNPLFVNAGARDFGLQAGSPAIDAGIDLRSQVPYDFTGKDRPEGTAYDIGAFEGAGSRANVLPGGPGSGTIPPPSTPPTGTPPTGTPPTGSPPPSEYPYEGAAVECPLAPLGGR